MSVGSTTGFPASIASTASSTRRASVDNSLKSREILPDPHVVVTKPRQERRHVAGVSVAVSRTSGAPGARHDSARSTSPRSPHGRQRLAGLEARDLRLEAADLLGPHVGRIQTTRSNGPSRPANSSPCTSSTRSVRPARALFSSATASAPDELSVATTRAPGCRRRSRVRWRPSRHRCRARGAASSASSSRQRSTMTSVSGRGIDTHGRPGARAAGIPTRPARRRAARGSHGARRAHGKSVLGRRAPRRCSRRGPCARSRERARAATRCRHAARARRRARAPRSPRRAALGSSRLERAVTLLGGKSFGVLVELTVEDHVEPVRRQLDPVVRERFSAKLYVRIFSARSPDPICERRVASCSSRCFRRSSS